MRQVKIARWHGYSQGETPGSRQVRSLSKACKCFLLGLKFYVNFGAIILFTKYTWTSKVHYCILSEQYHYNLDSELALHEWFIVIDLPISLFG